MWFDLRDVSRLSYHPFDFLLFNFCRMNDSCCAHAAGHLAGLPAISGTDVHHNVARPEIQFLQDVLALLSVRIPAAGRSPILVRT